MVEHLTLAAGPEFDRIRGILRTIGPSAAGVGDDCAFISMGDEILAVSVDLSVENVHFRREWLTFREIGWRAAAGALSDLAAVGAEVIGVLAAVASPPESGPQDLHDLMAGIGDAAHYAGGAVLGGDLSRGSAWLIDVTVLGRTSAPVRRTGARAGDGLFVTGELGGSAAALMGWLRGDAPGVLARERFAHPLPRLTAGRWLATHGARAMIDLSDGLAGDAAHLAAASGVRIDIDLARLPLDPSLATPAVPYDERPEVLAARGGEDYELLVALPPEFDADAVRQFESDIGVRLTRIGQVMAGQRVRLSLDGSPIDLTGFDHFR